MVQVSMGVKTAPMTNHIEVNQNRDSSSQRIQNAFNEVDFSFQEGRRACFNQPVREIKEVKRLSKETLGKVRLAIEESKKAEGRSIYALVGVTGTGKSTAVNALSDIAMVKKGRKVAVKKPEEEIAKIGQSAVHSQTEFVEIIKQQHSDFTFADCGGFLDTGGVEKQIVVETSVKFTLENAKEVRLIPCFDSKLLDCDRGVHFDQFLNHILGSFLSDYQKQASSLIFMFTKPSRGMDTQQIIEILEEMRDELAEGRRRDYYDFLLRDQGKYICCLDPLRESSIRGVKEKLYNMDSITNTKEAFKLAYSPDVKIQLLEEMTAIAACGNEVLQRHFNLKESLARCGRDVADLDNKMKGIKHSLAVIGEGKSDPKALKMAEESLVKQHEGIIKENKQKISELETLISKVPLDSIKQRIAALKAEGEKEKLYWSDFHKQEGINIESRVVIKTHSSKSGFMGIGASSSSKTEEKVTGDKRPIQRDFRYQGPVIAKIEKRPEKKSYWSQEKKTDTSYSVHYKTADGEAADAVVEVYVKTKDCPEELTKMAALQQEAVSKVKQVADYKEDIQKYQELVNQSQIVLADKEHNLKDIKAFEKNLKELGELKAKTEKQKTDLQAQIEKNKQAIDQQMSEVEVLQEYLSISQDKELASKEIIAQLLLNIKQYQEDIRG